MKLGVYCRVSGLSQRENSSLGNQKTLGIEFCKRSGFSYEVFEDVESGGKLNRKQFSKLLKLCKSGDIDGLWVYDNDRLGRDYDVSGEIRQIIQQYNLKLFVGWEEVKLDESKDRFNYNIRSVMSDYERMRINERFNYGKKRAYMEGRGLGMLPFGYSKNKQKEVIIDEKESEIVREIHKLYLRKDIKFKSDVERRLINKYGKIVNGKRTNGGLVGRVLGNKCYLGKIYKEDCDGNRYTFDIGQIIDEKIIDRVNMKLGKMKGVRDANRKLNYLLKGKVKCGCCDSSMWVKRGGKVSKVDGKVFSYYYCNNEERKKKYKRKFDKYVIEENKFRKNKKVDLEEYERMYGKFSNCTSLQHNTISIKKLEELVWKSLYDFVLKSDKIKKEYKIRYKKKLGLKDKFKGKLKHYNKELSKEEDKKMKMYDKWLEGLVDDDFKEKWERRQKVTIKKLKENITTIESEIDRYEVVSNIDSYIDLMKRDIKREFGVRRFEDKRRVIEKYVEKVSVKQLNGNMKCKEYEIKIELFYEGEEEDKTTLKLLYSTLHNSFYKLKYGLAHTHSLIYKRKIHLTLLYNYKIHNVGLRMYDKNKNKRLLQKVY